MSEKTKAKTNIPLSWESVKLGEFVENEKGKKPKRQSIDKTKEFSLPYVDIEAFEDGNIKSWTDGDGCRLCYESDFLMVWDGSRSGLVGKGIKGALGSTLVRINFPGMHNEYAYYFLLSKYQEINTRAKGSGTPHVDPNLLWNYDFPIAPLNEQKRIVAKIEELFSELDNGIAALKTAREQLKVYCQAVLKHAFEGKLTAKWREENADKLETPEQLLARIQQERDSRYQQQLEKWEAVVKEWEMKGKEGKKPGKPKKPGQIKTAVETDWYELPKKWMLLKLGDFIEKIDAGKSFKCDEREPTFGEIGVAKVSAVTWGEYNESESKTCLDLTKINPDYFIKNDDFILSRANTIELVGACVITRKVTKPIMLSDKTLRINFSGINQRYVLQYLRSHFGRNEIMNKSTGNQESMRNIGQDSIKSIVIPVCGSSEMDAIETSIHKKLESVSQLLKEIEIQLSKAEVLRQSILKKAFSGQLVPQDPNDEPASALLMRIQDAKELSSSSNQIKKRKGK